ncbi:MAG: hypothetical protein JO149_01970 [Gammaproteobacteria bacterium]|nr:hypothetical protein [Gammaproteobacteria bacterium]
MDARDELPKEEQWLIQAIKAKDAYAAETIIELIDTTISTPGSPLPHLDTLDEEGNSYLSLSFIKESNTIADLLFDSLKNNETILFAKNNKNQTLIWLAAKYQHATLLEKLLSAALSAYHEGRLKEKIWLTPSIIGNLPFHAAITADIDKIDALAYLLKTLKQIDEFELLEHINLTNRLGDTPLHLALEQKNIAAAALLTQHGAYWTVVNDHKKTPFDYFCTYLTKAEQQLLIHALRTQKEEIYETNEIKINEEGDQILTKIEKKRLVIDRKFQNYFLNIYQLNLIKKHLHTSKEAYQAFAGQVSLKNSIIAQAAIDSPAFHETSVEDQSTIIPYHDDDVCYQDANNQMTDESHSEIMIEMDVLNTNPDIHSPKEVLSIIQQKSNDRLMLTELLEALEKGCNDFKNNPRLSERKHALSVILPVIGWLVFWGVEAWFIHEKMASNDLTGCKYVMGKSTYHWCNDTSHPASQPNQAAADLKLIIFSLLGGVANLILTFASYTRWWKAEKPITEAEYKETITLLDNFLLEKLNKLPEELTPANHSETLMQLKIRRNELDHHQPRDEAHIIYRHLYRIVRQMRIDFNLNLYPKGLTLYQPAVKEESSSRSELVKNIQPLTSMRPQ